MVGPLLALPVILSLYAITTFIFRVVDVSSIVARSVNVIYSLLGILAVMGIIIGVPIGIILIVIDSRQEKK